MTGLFSELGYSVRNLARRPFLSLTAIVTLVLALAATTTLFNLRNAFFQRLPVPNASRLVSVYTSSEMLGAHGTTSYLDYVDYRDGNKTLESLATETSFGANLSHSGSAEWVWGAAISDNYFPTLGVRLLHGRPFTAEDGKTGANPVTVLSHRLFARRFGADPQIVGKTVEVNGTTYTVVGVAPPGFLGSHALFHPAMWTPIRPERMTRRELRNMSIIGLLKPGVSVEQAQANFATLAAGVEKTYPEPGSVRQVTVTPSTPMPPVAREWYLPSVRVLLVAVGLLLLIAGINVANLLLGLAMDRRAETGTRLALGAGRLRLVRQSFWDALVLTVVGGFFGFLLSLSLRHKVAQYFAPATPGDMGDAPPLTPDLKVFAFLLGICLLTALIAGLLPALKASATDLTESIKSRRGGNGRGGRGGLSWLSWNNVLVVVQVALSTVLLIAAGLLVRSFRHLYNTDPGYKVENVLLVSLDVQPLRLQRPEAAELYERIRERIAAVPGIQKASLINTPPLAGFSLQEAALLPERPDQELQPDAAVVGADYFETLGLKIDKGRALGSEDGPDAPGAVVVNELLARQYWPRQDPLGRTIQLPNYAGRPAGNDFRVVGVVPNTRYLSLGEEPRALLYLPAAQGIQPRMVVIARTAAPPETVMDAVRKELRAIEPNLPILYMTTLERYLEGSIWEPRMRAEVLQALGILALILTAVGVFGILSYAVSRRYHELGVRMTLGATPGKIVGMVLRDGVVLTLIGILLGLPAAFWAQKFLTSFFFGIETGDVVTFIAVPLFLLAVAALAAWLPARRASRIDPLKAVRAE